MFLIDKVVGEMRDRPWTMLILCGLICVSTYLLHSGASAGDLASVSKDIEAVKMDVAAVKSDVSKLKTDGRRSSLEAQLRSINSELFERQRQVEELRRVGRPVDRIYFDRIDALTNDKAALERELATLPP